MTDYTSLTAKFQKVLDSQNLGVKGLYLGNSRMGIIGTTAKVARACALIGRIYTVDSVTELDDGKTAVTVIVPTPEVAQQRFDVATAGA